MVPLRCGCETIERMYRCVVLWLEVLGYLEDNDCRNSTSAPRSGEARGGAIDSEKGNSSEKWTAF